MKVIFEFNTDSEDFSPRELRKFQDVDKMTSCIFEIEEKLHEWFNHEERNELPVDEVVSSLNEIFNKHDVCSDYYIE